MQDELLEGIPALGHDQQAACLATGDKGFLDRAPAGDDLIAGFDQARFSGFEAGPAEGGGPSEVGAATIERRAIRPIAERSRGRRAVPIGATALGAEGSPAGRPERPLERRSIGTGAVSRRFTLLEAGPIGESPGPFETWTRSLIADIGAVLAFGPAPEAEAGPGRARPVKPGAVGSGAVEPGSIALGAVEPGSIALGPPGPGPAAGTIVARPLVAGPAEAGAIVARTASGSIERRPVEGRTLERGAIAARSLIRAARNALVGPEAGRTRAAATGPWTGTRAGSAGPRAARAR